MRCKSAQTQLTTTPHREWRIYMKERKVLTLQKLRVDS